MWSGFELAVKCEYVNKRGSWICSEGCRRSWNNNKIKKNGKFFRSWKQAKRKRKFWKEEVEKES